MKAIVYHGPGDQRLETVPDPKIQAPTDVITRITTTTICGTDLHILKGDVPAVKPGTILGHEAVGIVEEVGSAITRFHVGDKVIIPSISTCGTCEYCRRQMYGQCLTSGGGWILGHLIDGLMAQYARVPLADTSLYLIPEGQRDADMVLLCDILPTGYECGVLRGNVQPGDTVVIVGAGPVGLCATLTAPLHGPSQIISIDLDDGRLQLAQKVGATRVINPSRQNVQEEIARLTGLGVDVAIEAVGVPQTFEMCTEIIRPGGRVANIGVHGHPVPLHLERLWDKDVTITTQKLITKTLPMLLRLIQMGKLDPSPLATHTFSFEQFPQAFDVFSHAAEYGACKVMINNQ